MTSSSLVASRVNAALADRSWSFDGSGRCHLFLVQSGSAVLTRPEQPDADLRGPALLWIPHMARGRLRVAAGGDGFTASITPVFVQRAVSDPGLTLHVHPLLDRVVLAGPDMLARDSRMIAQSFAVLVDESEQLPATADPMMGLHLASVLLVLWRCSRAGVPAGPRGAGATIVQRFRQLVELHYREGLRIDDFAGRLGVTREQLHDACLRATGRTPLVLVHERLVAEACARLEQTDLSVEQVAYGIGFRDPGYFNRFFKRQTGQSPGAYRRTALAGRRPVTAPSFAAWP